MCAGKFPLVSTGGRANGQACTDGEQGPPSARAEIYIIHLANNKVSTVALFIASSEIKDPHSQCLAECDPGKIVYNASTV